VVMMMGSKMPVGKGMRSHAADGRNGSLV
jgi:hypothetical protein